MTNEGEQRSLGRVQHGQRGSEQATGRKISLSVALFGQFASSLQEANRWICFALSASGPLGFPTLRRPRGGQRLPLTLVKTDTPGDTHCLSLPVKHKHKYTLRQQWESEMPCNTWCRCEDVAKWEFPKAVKYACYNSGGANSRGLTTSVQRKGAFTGQAEHLPCKYSVSLPTHLFCCYTV